MNWKIYLDLKYEDCGKLCGICDTMKDRCDIDVRCGRYIVDGTSLLGVMSIIGHEIELVPVTDDENLVTEFYNKVSEIGAYIKNF